MNKRLLIRLSAACFAIAGLWTALTQPQPPVEFTVEKIADDLHVIVGGGGNVAVYSTPEGTILVDDKFDQHVPQILAKVKTVTDKPVRYVLNTHHHGDHTGGNQKLQEQNVEIIIQQNARANMVRLKQPGIPRIAFSGETAVYLGGKEVRARHFGRGHTNGDAVVLFPARRTLHTGDLFVGGTPLIDYTAGGSGVEWTNTLKAALQLDFDTVIPGHGPIMNRAGLEKWISTFEAVRQRISEQQKKGMTKEQVVSGLKIDDLGWTSSSNWTGRSLPGLFDELAR
jgi:glyoxylase-like metal-dependent hydrolase (beta-lactamase superfamily II)